MPKGLEDNPRAGLEGLKLFWRREASRAGSQGRTGSSEANLGTPGVLKKASWRRQNLNLEVNW